MKYLQEISVTDQCKYIALTITNTRSENININLHNKSVITRFNSKTQEQD